MSADLGPVLDLVVEHGTVLDGSGAPAHRADVGIVDDRIVAVGDLRERRAGTRIDATGKVVTPGFIDVHGHDDAAALVDPTVYWKLRQGVTTIVVGNCGFGPAPFTAAIDDFVAWWPAVRALPDWGDHHGFARRVDEVGPALHLAMLVGHGSVRTEAMGRVDRAPDARELAVMRRRVEEGMAAGAVGLSTGLIYSPGRFATADEIAALAAISGAAGGLYTSHIRDEGDELLAAVAEAIDIGRVASVAVQLSHHKAYGRRNWGKVHESLALVAAARADGRRVAADVYPYTVSATMLGAVVENEYLVDDGRGPLLTGEAITITSAPGRPEWIGRTVADLAAAWTVDVVTAAERAVAELGMSVMVAIDSMDESDVATVMVSPGTMIGSDGVIGDGNPHPRAFSTFPRVLGRYVRGGVLDLPDAVHRMTGLPAATFGLTGRGRIGVGAVADLVVLDPATVEDRSTFTEPDRAPVGIDEVLVAGRRAIAAGALTGTRAGRFVPRG